MKELADVSRRKEGGAETDEEDRKPPPLSGGMTAHPKNPGKPTRMTAHTKREFSKVAEKLIQKQPPVSKYNGKELISFVTAATVRTRGRAVLVGTGNSAG